MKNLIKSAIGGICLLAFATHPFYAFGQDAVSGVDKFALWHNCDAVFLDVESIDQDDNETSLTDEKVETAVRSRLRSARIYREDFVGLKDPHVPYLYINVTIIGRAYSIDIALLKFLSDPISKTNSFAKTWSTGSTGTHGGDGNFILSNISQHTDKFIDEYLRVNESACR